MTHDENPETKEGAAARRELMFSIALLVAALVVFLLATRGFWSFAWFFPHIFGGIAAFASLLSLRTSRHLLWKPRLALAVIIIVISALLPWLHVRGVDAKMKSYERRAGEALIGTMAPAIPFVATLHHAEEGAGSLALGGRISLINFWATWCGPCVEEIPLLQRFWSEGRGQGLEVLGVTKLYEDIGTTAEVKQIEAFLAERNVDYPVLIGDGSEPTHAAYLVESLPTSILVDSNGKIVAFGAGIRGTQRLMAEAEKLVSAVPVAHE